MPPGMNIRDSHATQQAALNPTYHKEKENQCKKPCKPFLTNKPMRSSRVSVWSSYETSIPGGHSPQKSFYSSAMQAHPLFQIFCTSNQQAFRALNGWLDSTSTNHPPFPPKKKKPVAKHRYAAVHCHRFCRSMGGKYFKCVTKSALGVGAKQ